MSDDHQASGPQRPLVGRERLELGPALRAARREKSFSLKELEAISGVTHSTISRIENGKISATWDTVVALCGALDIRVDQLVATEEDRLSAPKDRVVLVRADEVAEISYGGTRYQLHYGLNMDSGFSPIVMTISNRSLEESGGLQSHAGQEFSYVLEGLLRVHMQGFDPVDLRKGESIQFSSEIPHAYVCVSDGPAKTLTVLAGSPPNPPEILDRLIKRVEHGRKAAVSGGD